MYDLKIYEFIYGLLPYFTLALLALALLFKIHKRSVSTFLTILASALVINLNRYGFGDSASLVLLIFLIVLLFRAILKPTNDTFLVKTYIGAERRNINR